ncbi:MAG: IS1634 family transposase [Candidatus Omnitrophica bacterium]|nr:IS1634 family transposase [Candidatus Omnitrophota bacterium]
MAYFLKKSNLKRGIYLQIYESFYDHDKKETAHKSYKAIGYVQDLIASGISDPIAYYSDVVAQMNIEAKRIKEENEAKQIGESPEMYLGYFLLQSIYDSLKVSNYLDLMQSVRGFRFRLSGLIEALVYSRVVDPCSKNRTCHDVLPKLYESYNLSYDQILDGVEYMGNEYEKIIEIFTHQVSLKYSLDTSATYFDCTNFYFEIDKEDELRKKGPSKENRNDPIIGLGLLLDANQIPICMKLYPGNESEKPVIRDVIKELKDRNQVSGKTVQVADKGLNCAENVINALKNKDGYLFSKSVKQLPETEKTWILLKDGYKEVIDSDGTLLYKIKECIDEFPYTYTDENGKKHTVRLKEKRVATYNPKLAEKKKYEINKMVEKAKMLKACQAKKSEFGECGKYVAFDCADRKGNAIDGKVRVTINQDAIDKDLMLAGYNLLVTSEIKMRADDIYNTYHNLWRIEESFKVMKTYLDARPVFLQKAASIHGHFLICYLAVLLIRLLQFKVLKNKYCTEKLINFIRDFRVVKLEHNKYVNITSSSKFIKSLSADLKLPITKYFLNESQIKMMLNYKF